MADDRQLPATADPDNLYWVMSEAKFMYLPTRTLFDRNAVIRQIGGETAQVIETTKVVSNLFWSPGLPTFMENVAVIDGELFEHPGNNLLNLYKGPDLKFQGDPAAAEFWLELGRYLFGDDVDHLIKCLAFKTQHPEEKINHALVIGSYDQGIGKDSWLGPVRRGIGYHNFNNVTAGLAVEWTKRGFTAPILRQVITRISEVHDLGAERFRFYDMTKDWAASPPETLLVADKNVKAHRISECRASDLFDQSPERWHVLARRRSPTLLCMVTAHPRRHASGLLAQLLGWMGLRDCPRRREQRRILERLLAAHQSRCRLSRRRVLVATGANRRLQSGRNAAAHDSMARRRAS